jgi:hypothetical protein
MTGDAPDDNVESDEPSHARYLVLRVEAEVPHVSIPFELLEGLDDASLVVPTDQETEAVTRPDIEEY